MSARNLKTWLVIAIIVEGLVVWNPRIPYPTFGEVDVAPATKPAVCFSTMPCAHVKAAASDRALKQLTEPAPVENQWTGPSAGDDGDGTTTVPVSRPGFTGWDGLKVWTPFVAHLLQGIDAAIILALLLGLSLRTLAAKSRPVSGFRHPATFRTRPILKARTDRTFGPGRRLNS